MSAPALCVTRVRRLLHDVVVGKTLHRAADPGAERSAEIRPR